MEVGRTCSKTKGHVDGQPEELSGIITNTRKRGKQRTRWNDDLKKLLTNGLYHRINQSRHEWKRLEKAFALNRA